MIALNCPREFSPHPAVERSDELHHRLDRNDAGRRRRDLHPPQPVQPAEADLAGPDLADRDRRHRRVSSTSPTRTTPSARPSGACSSVEARLQSLALKSFDLAKPPAAAKFVIEAEDSGQPLKLANFSGPFPSYGRTGRLGRINVALPNVFAVHADMSVEADDGVRFTQTDAEGRALREGEPGPWFRPTDRLPFAHGSDLKRADAAGARPCPRSRPTARTRSARWSSTFRTTRRRAPSCRWPSSGFLRPSSSMSGRRRRIEPCAAVITVPMRFEIEPPQSETRMHVTPAPDRARGAVGGVRGQAAVLAPSGAGRSSSVASSSPPSCAEA